MPYDSGFAIVRDKAILAHAMTQWSSYLPTIAQGDRVPSNYVPELSRRGRGVPVWAVIRHFGRDGIAAMVERALPRRRGSLPRFWLPSRGSACSTRWCSTSSSLAFGDDGTERPTEAVIAKVQQDGVCYVGGAEWRGEWVMRISVISEPTTDADIDAQRRLDHCRLAGGAGGALGPEGQGRGAGRGQSPKASARRR